MFGWCLGLRESNEGLKGRPVPKCLRGSVVPFAHFLSRSEMSRLSFLFISCFMIDCDKDVTSASPSNLLLLTFFVCAKSERFFLVATMNGERSCECGEWWWIIWAPLNHNHYSGTLPQSLFCTGVDRVGETGSGRDTKRNEGGMLNCWQSSVHRSPEGKWEVGPDISVPFMLESHQSSWAARCLIHFVAP